MCDVGIYRNQNSLTYTNHFLQHLNIEHDYSIIMIFKYKTKRIDNALSDLKRIVSEDPCTFRDLDVRDNQVFVIITDRDGQVIIRKEGEDLLFIAGFSSLKDMADYFHKDVVDVYYDLNSLSEYAQFGIDDEYYVYTSATLKNEDYTYEIMKGMLYRFRNLETSCYQRLMELTSMYMRGESIE